jgi:hypothetical protein
MAFQYLKAHRRFEVHSCARSIQFSVSEQSSTEERDLPKLAVCSVSDCWCYLFFDFMPRSLNDGHPRLPPVLLVVRFPNPNRRSSGFRLSSWPPRSLVQNQILTEAFSTWSFYVPLFGTLVNLGLLYWKRHSPPWNFVLLSTFTLVEAFTLGVVVAFFDNVLVLQAL